MGTIELPVLRDDRVLLRAVEPRDLPAIDAGMNDPDVLRWIGPAWPLDELLPRVDALRVDGSPTLAICDPGDMCVGLVWVNVRDPERSIGYVGYWLLPAARGRGMATGAVRLMSAWARGALGLTAIRLRTARDNERSQRVAERSGFRRMMASLDAGAADEKHAEDVVFELPDVQSRLRT